MEDRSNEMLMPKEAAEALQKCMTCIWLEQCSAENWVITCDKDGKTCDNYKKDLLAQDYRENMKPDGG